ncbi:MAG: hypothetical protein L6N96_07110 [Candidatus Methylarchaceae archaeon HK02M2]|nr:hypothetical protein [Candidatus Methylarchaceae archaeon HK02M2]
MGKIPNSLLDGCHVKPNRKSKFMADHPSTNKNAIINNTTRIEEVAVKSRIFSIIFSSMPLIFLHLEQTPISLKRG